MGGSAGVVRPGAVGPRDDGRFGQGVVRVFRSDAHVQLLAGVGLGEETHQDNLFLKGIQDGRDVAEVERSASQVGRAGHDNLCLAGAGEYVGEGLTDGADRRTQLRSGRGRGRLDARRRGLGGRGVAVGAQVVAHGEQLAVVEGGVEAEGPLPHLAVGGDDNDENAPGGKAEDLEVLEGAHARTRVLHEGHLVGDLREEAHGAFHDVVNVDRVGEERFESLALRSCHGLDLGEPVDEDAVSAVGGHAPGGRVGLIDQPGFFQDRHVVANRGRGDAQAPGGNGLGADGFACGHVLGDDGAQDVKPAVLRAVACHVTPSVLALPLSECKCYSPPASGGDPGDA